MISEINMNGDDHEVQKWEYTILDFDKVFYSSKVDEALKKITESLNKLGQEGWELVCPATSNIHTFVLKRPIER